MTKKQIGAYYNNLNFGEKGRFTAYLSLNLGGSPHSWLQKKCFYGREITHPFNPYKVKYSFSMIKQKYIDMVKTRVSIVTLASDLSGVCYFGCVSI